MHVKRLVEVLGEAIAVRASVHTIGGFSAHADQGELLDWLRTFTVTPEVFIVHGEEKAALEFEAIVKERLNFKTYVPRPGDRFTI
jgi:metallo-beta-lactamase family protein